MKKLILHIGTHKTGSTAIQDWLTSQRANLRDQGVLYGRTDRPPDPTMPKHNSLFHALAREEGDFAAEKQAILREFHNSGCETLILSEEGMSEPFFAKFAPMRSLARHFEITVIVFFRRQDYFLESLWSQRVRQGLQRGRIDEVMVQPLTDRRLRFDRILDFWAGFAELRPRVYRSGDAIAAFADAAGLPAPLSPGLRRNTSPSMNAAAAMRLLNKARIPFNANFISALYTGDTRRSVLGSELRKRLLETYAESNARLNDRYGIAFDETLPDEPAAPLGLPELRPSIAAAARLPGVSLTWAARHRA